MTASCKAPILTPRMPLTLHDRFIDEAIAVKRMLVDRVEAAMAYVNEKLGFNAWSRDLDDHQQVFAFLLPVEIYDNERLRGHLWKFINNVFYAHFLSVEESHLMLDSSNESILEVMGEDSCERYEVDWHGSRSRKVELGPHLYFRLGFDGWIGRPRTDPEPPNMEIQGTDLAWEVVDESPDCYSYIQRARMITHTESQSP
jgi:hypothetical protein